MTVCRLTLSFAFPRAAFAETPQGLDQADVLSSETAVRLLATDAAQVLAISSLCDGRGKCEVRAVSHCCPTYCYDNGAVTVAMICIAIK